MPSETSAIQLDAQMCISVIEHMNDDHQDACLLMVQAFTEHTQATSARMTGLDAAGMNFSVSKEAENPCSTRVLFEKSASKPEQIRGLIVSLTKKARQKLQ